VLIGPTHVFLLVIRRPLPAQPLTLDVPETGLGLAERCGLSIFDAMIAASALHAGCEALWSEDMQDGMTLENRPRIVNPFSAAR